MTAKELFDIGLGYERLGKMDQALKSYARVIFLWPHEIEPYHRLSVIALQTGDLQMALAWTEKGLAVNGNIVELWNNRALALAELARYDEAHQAFNRAIALRPDNWEALYNLGRMLFIEKRYAEAEPPLQRAAELDPNSAVTFNNLGLVLHELYRYDEASSAFDKAIELKRMSRIGDDAYQNDYIEAISNKGASLYFAHKFSESSMQLRKAIELSTKANGARSAIGDAPTEQSVIEAGAHYNLASLLLCRGDLAGGFEEYEWRWKTKGWPKLRQYHGRPLWKRGERWMADRPLRGETIFVWHEQGFGDTIQFIRLIPELAKLDCEIVIEVQPALHRLLTASLTIPKVRFTRGGEKMPTFDMHVPLLSLPRMLGVTYENLSQFKPYVRPRGREIEDWRGKLKTMTLAENRKKRKIGIVWSGNPAHQSNQNRSMSWETIAPLVNAHKDRFQFYSLQLDNSALPDNSGVIDLSGSLTDFAVTAAIIANLDLVIAVDTSIVHLAGALGKRVWTMLFNTPDWRWMMDFDGIGGETTKWYPSMSLFWQKKTGVWADVVEEVSWMLAAI